MKQVLTLFAGLLLSFPVLAKKIAPVTQITGFAPTYVGRQIEVFQIVDYITMKQERIATTTVGADSTFTCSFFLDQTRKLVLSCSNNSGTLYASPGATYDIYFPDRNPHDPYRPLGNKVELKLYGLDSTDINYKILTFNRWVDEILGRYYTKHNIETKYFAQRIDTFKNDVAKYYRSDSSDTYFMTHVRYSLARIDNMRFLGSRNQYEKFDFYLRNTPVAYQSDAYMDYVNVYYEKMMTRVAKDVNDRFYKALLQSSPTLLMRALGTEYTMQNNLRLRELVMIKTLGDCFFERDYPQTNILTVLDSLAKHSMFPGNEVIAQNMILRLTELTPGGKAPDFTMAGPNGVLDLKKYAGKHLYLFFVEPGSKETQKQMELLVPIYQRYQKEIQFLMVVKKTEKSDANTIDALQKSVPWESIAVDSGNEIFKKYQVINMPYYTVIDPVGYIVAAPALGPLPNGQYETVDKLFFYIKKAIDDGTGDGR